MRISTTAGATLRLSLLFALGLSPGACGGTSSSTGELGGDAGSSGSGTGGGGGGGKMPESCSNPEIDPVTQLVQCAEGYRHRPQAVACSPVADAAAPSGGASGIPGPALPRANGENCTSNPSACDAFQYGFCEKSPQAVSEPPAFCRSGCVIDDDCGAGFFCQCGASASPTGGTCVPSECRTDADCEEGYKCASYRGGCGPDGFACQTKNDTCTYADCVGLMACKSIGAADGHRECQSIPVCGRPFLVESSPRIAPVVASGAWDRSLQPLPRVDGLSSYERATQAEHWARMGQMEHASIAAFARFSLQLLSLGAPPELIEACTRAQADETAHAKLCFRFASAYAGAPVGPGPLDVAHSLDVTTLADVVDLVLLEGCQGETRAVLEALELAEGATDLVVRRAYEQIAGDEERHAALAFQFVRWALSQDPDGVRARITDALRAARFSDACARDVVVPCLSALLEGTGAASLSRVGIELESASPSRARAT